MKFRSVTFWITGTRIICLETECIDLDMSIEEGAKMILSAGLIVPEKQIVDKDGSSDGLVAAERT